MTRRIYLPKQHLVKLRQYFQKQNAAHPYLLHLFRTF